MFFLPVSASIQCPCSAKLICGVRTNFGRLSKHTKVWKGDHSLHPSLPLPLLLWREHLLMSQINVSILSQSSLGQIVRGAW